MNHDDADARLGDLIAAAFDEAAHFSTDPREVSRLATRAVVHILEGTLDAPPPERTVPHALSTGGRRASATALRLVPPEGPKLRLLPRPVLRLVSATTPASDGARSPFQKGPRPTKSRPQHND